MSIKTTKEVCKKFFCNQKPNVLEIDGAWGSGKTYLWQNFLINDAIASKTFSGCAYASLFGVASLDELKATILIGYKPTNWDNQETQFQKFRRNAILWAQSHNSTIQKIVRYIPEGVQRWAPKEILKDLVGIGSHLAFSYRVNSSLICLDDIERTDWTLITPETLLGFINWLKTDRRCSVILIVNGSELGNGRKAYERFHEKIIDVRAKFQPTPDELLPVVFNESYPRRVTICQYIGLLNISNIRIHQRIRFLLDTFFARFKGLPPDIETQIIASVVLLCWIIYGAQSPKIEISYLKSRKLYRRPSEAPETAESVAVESLLTRYGFGVFDEIDECLVPFVRDGHLEGNNIESVLNQAVEKFAKNNSQQLFFNAWRLFHDSFDDNEEKFVKALSGAAISAARDGLSLNNLNSAVRLLRDLGRDSIAETVIELYVRANADNRAALDLSHPFAFEVTDNSLREAVEKQAASLTKSLSLQEAGRIIVAHGDREADARFAFALASVEEIVAVLRMDWGSDPHSLCAELLAPTADPAHAKVAQKTFDALKAIGETSALNALRVARYTKKAE